MKQQVLAPMREGIARARLIEQAMMVGYRVGPPISDTPRPACHPEVVPLAVRLGWWSASKPAMAASDLCARVAQFVNLDKGPMEHRAATGSLRAGEGRCLGRAGDRTGSGVADAGMRFSRSDPMRLSAGRGTCGRRAVRQPGLSGCAPARAVGGDRRRNAMSRNDPMQLSAGPSTRGGAAVHQPGPSGAAGRRMRFSRSYPMRPSGGRAGAARRRMHPGKSYDFRLGRAPPPHPFPSPRCGQRKRKIRFQCHGT